MATSEQRRIVAVLVLTLGPLSAISGTIPGYFLGDQSLAGAGVGALIGFLIGSGMVAFEVSWGVGLIGRRIREASFLRVVATKSLTWLAIIVIGLSVPMILVGGVPPSELFATTFLVSIGISFGIAMIFVAGRYHTPREEDRIFLFVDLRSSTQINAVGRHGRGVDSAGSGN